MKNSQFLRTEVIKKNKSNNGWLTFMIAFCCVSIDHVILSLWVVLVAMFAVLFALFLDFFHFGTLILKPNLKNACFLKNWLYYTSGQTRVSVIVIIRMFVTWTMRKLNPVSLAKFSRTFRHGFGDTSNDALKARRCCVFKMVRGLFGPRRPSIFDTNISSEKYSSKFFF